MFYHSVCRNQVVRWRLPSRHLIFEFSKQSNVFNFRKMSTFIGVLIQGIDVGGLDNARAAFYDTSCLLEPLGSKLVPLEVGAGTCTAGFYGGVTDLG